MLTLQTVDSLSKMHFILHALELYYHLTTKKSALNSISGSKKVDVRIIALLFDGECSSCMCVSRFKVLQRNYINIYDIKFSYTWTQYFIIDEFNGTLNSFDPCQLRNLDNDQSVWNSVLKRTNLLLPYLSLYGDTNPFFVSAFFISCTNCVEQFSTNSARLSYDQNIIFSRLNLELIRSSRDSCLLKSS